MRDILVIDDDTELCQLLSEYLTPEGFRVTAVHDGKQGLEQALAGGHDLVVLDVMLPGLNGFDVLRLLRAESRVPVLMLTARGDEVDRIVGLEMGADDYLPKPFNPRELVARIRAIGRRAESTGEAAPEVAESPLCLGDLTVDPGKRLVLLGEEKASLTAVEFNLLLELVRSAGRVVGREELARKVLGRKLALFDRSVDVHISSLRKKLGPRPDGSERISTVRGAGYCFLLPDSEA